MELEFLANNKKAIPILANWYFDEWGHLKKGNTFDKVTEKLQHFLNIDKIPLIVLAVEGREILGAAQLKYTLKRNIGLEGGMYLKNIVAKKSLKNNCKSYYCC